MKRFTLLCVLAAACGGSQNTGPVAGAREAAARHYAVTVDRARAAVVEVLKTKYGRIAKDDGFQVTARSVCRDIDGDPCTEFPHREQSAGQQDPLSVGPTAASGTPRTTTETTGHYTFQVFASAMGTDGDVQIQIGGEAKDFEDHEFASDAAGSPAWMPHEVDEVRVAVDHALAKR
jgi:hypothetical protein